MLVNDFLQNSADQFPNKVALICDGQHVTYAQIEEQANQLANGLLALGIRRRDRVAVWLPNTVEAVIAIFAILKAGATFLVVNPTTKPGKLAYVLNNCAASGLFGLARHRKQVDELLDAAPSARFAVVCGKGASEASSTGVKPGIEARSKVVSFRQLLENHPATRPPAPQSMSTWPA